MDKYKIYCTPEQARKALKLGAPINEAMSRYNARSAIQDVESEKKTLEDYAIRGIALVNDKYLKKALNIPTAEEMLGWLEEQGILILIDTSQNKFYGAYSLRREDGYWFNRIFLDGLYPSRKEAIIAAIDAVLEYLKTLKNK